MAINKTGSLRMHAPANFISTNPVMLATTSSTVPHLRASPFPPSAGGRTSSTFPWTIPSTVKIRSSVGASRAYAETKPQNNDGSLYGVLGLPGGASCGEIRAAYRRLARSFHPDVAAVDQKASHDVEFMKIHSAYATLSDSSKRADYDRRKRWCTTFHRPSIPKNWETDQCW